MSRWILLVAIILSACGGAPSTPEPPLTAALATGMRPICEPTDDCMNRCLGCGMGEWGPCAAMCQEQPNELGFELRPAPDNMDLAGLAAEPGYEMLTELPTFAQPVRAVVP